MKRSILFIGGALVLLACTANTVINADLPGRGDVPANATEVSACKDSCTARAKCADAKPDCESLCDATSSDGAVGFKKCVQKDACDPACDAPLASTPDASTPPPPPPPAPAADASTKDAASDGLAACIAACSDSKIVECADGTTAQCTSRCNATTPAARSAFATCTSSATCANFVSGCWSPFMGAN